MAQFTPLLTIGNFASGVLHYRDHYPGQEQLARMVIKIIVAGRQSVEAIVDTGTPWCILDSEVIARLGSTVQIRYAPPERLNIRGISYEGRLSRLGIILEAVQGSNLEVDATVFVPMLDPGEIWPHPNFIGLEGFLSRIRFAVDPSENAFYFGPL